ncbi:MAG: hypothetical protein KDK97_05095, partial [Verrucomicrobiales bacterium]|nr:hypothetical protein [Verrucomicrobiales bacterium]
DDGNVKVTGGRFEHDSAVTENKERSLVRMVRARFEGNFLRDRWMTMPELIGHYDVRRTSS